MDSFSGIKAQALRVLTGLEQGSMQGAQAVEIMEELDPVLNFFIIRYLREKYPSSHEHGAAVIGRIVEVTNAYPKMVTQMKQAEKDPVVEWYDDTYRAREFAADPEGFIELVVDKLEM